MSHSFLTSPHRIRVLGVLGFLGVVLVAAGCDALFPDEEADAIDRNTFIDVQVELRLAAADAEVAEIPQAQRDSILDDKGVTDEQLAAFLTVHGSDEDFMTDLWMEVDRKVLEARGMEPEEDPDRIDPPEDEDGPPSG